tara:strand:+ start:614 stop:1165 length:552 start_codon:yes stop_codon:yes gene_type:complete
MKLQDIIKDIELGKVYTDKDKPPFKVNEVSLKRWKVYVSGQSEPLTLLGKDAKSVKQLAYQMIQNSSVRVRKVVREGLDEVGDMDRPQGFSSPEAKKVIDSELKDWAKDLRKVQGRVVKTWMSKAKSGVIDYFDLIRGLQTGDARRAHPYEVDFLMKLLTKDKIINRFRSYFGGKKGKASRTK